METVLLNRDTGPVGRFFASGACFYLSCKRISYTVLAHPILTDGALVLRWEIWETGFEALDLPLFETAIDARLEAEGARLEALDLGFFDVSVDAVPGRLSRRGDSN